MKKPVVQSPEPDYAAACAWWRDLPDIWTPVGWKNHLLHFNVFFNGTILAAPDLNQRTTQWKGQAASFTFVAATPFQTFEDFSPLHRIPYTHSDDGMVRQGWNDSSAPVLWSDYAQNGSVLRQEVFGHIPGGKDVATGIEPLFAWVRLSVTYVCKALPVDAKHGFLIKIEKPNIAVSMSMRNNLRFNSDQTDYPRKLAPEGAYDPNRGYRLLEEDGRVRLGSPAGQRTRIEFSTGTPNNKGYLLYVQMDNREGACADLLIPMLPVDRETFDRELALGYNRALREANQYWSAIPAAAARVVTPERGVNETIRHSLKFAELLAEKNPADGQYSIVSGSFVYDNLWATPGSMIFTMLLDALGYHEQAERYLAIFHKYQGTVNPPGKSFAAHPGYLSSPKSMTSIDWLPDHGALLYSIANHALVSGNRAFAGEWIDVILKACEFIRDARLIKGHGGFEGIMPPAVATDNMTEIQSVWTDGWIYKGLTAAVRLLKQIAHPRAAEFDQVARDYRTAFQKAIREKTRTMPTWTDRRGRKHRFVPTALFGDTPGETLSPFYLDAGPLFLVYGGLLDAGDELMKSTTLWFREGPPQAMYRYDGNMGQIAALHREMSSCEPCYSWNVFHSWQAGDRARFLEGMYSLFAGSVSRKTFISCETRGGITGTCFSAPLPIYMARLAMVDDQIKEGELHLLRLAPLAWLRARSETKFEDLPTEFGPVTLKVRLSRDGRTLVVTFRPQFRQAPARIVLHVPPVPGLRQVTVNGQKLSAGRKVHIL